MKAISVENKILQIIPWLEKKIVSSVSVRDQIVRKGRDNLWLNVKHHAIKTTQKISAKSNVNCILEKETSLMSNF